METMTSKPSNPHNRGNAREENKDDYNLSSADHNQNKYKKLISTLPKDDGSTIPGAEFFQSKYHGFWYYESLLEGLLAARDSFKALPSDIILCSAPKSGTTWLKALSFAILTRNNHLHNQPQQTSPLHSSMPHDLIPFIEIDIGTNCSQFNRDSLLQVPLLATHSPYSALPESILSAGCKIVYICRNPKDVFVSLWHFINTIRRSKYKENEPIPIEKSLHEFCQGISYSGPYWDHVLEYWEASLDRPDKILFLKYEDMTRDTIVYVKRLAEFLGQPFSSEEEVQGAVERIVEMCSFDKLSNLEVNKNGKHRADTAMEIDNNVYFRKGKVGDWVSYLTNEMADKIDKITYEKLKGSGLDL